MQRLNRVLLMLAPAVTLAVNPMLLRAQQATTDASVTTDDATTRPAPPASKEISLNFKDASVDAVLSYLSEKAGFIILKQDGDVEGRVTVMSKYPVTPDEAVVLLNAVLRARGYTAIRAGGRILKIMSSDKAKRANLPVHFGGDPNQIPDTDELITQVIPVRSVDAKKLMTDIQPLVGADADITSNAGSNTIVMTDTSANIRRVVEIISAMDKRDASDNTIHVRHLMYADATAAAKLIMDIFSPTTTGQTQTPQQQFFRAAFGGGGAGGGFGGGRGGGFGGGPGGAGGAGAGASASGADEGQTGHVIASADTRTNTVVVSGPVDTLGVIDKVLDQIDANPAADQTFFLYAVKNGQAVDMQATLNALFSGSTTGTTNRTNTNPLTSGANASRGTAGGTSALGGGGGGLGGGGGGLGGGGGRGGGGGGGLGGGGGGLGGGGGGFGGGGGTTAFGGGGANRGGIGGGFGGGGGNSALSNGALADLIGQVYVVADQDTNSLLVATATKYQDQVRQIINALDRPVGQVLIKVLIAEVTHNDSSDLGLDFSAMNTRGAPSTTVPGFAGQSVAPGTAVVSNLGSAAQQAENGGLAVNVLEGNFTATLHALASAGKLDVLSRPYILASDNQQATINDGQDVPYVSDSRLDTNNNPINTVLYTPIGITLTVTPHINPEGLVTMNVAPSISSLTTATIQTSPGLFSPIFQTRSAQTYIAIKDGQTIVIGGLMQDTNTSTITKVPILGSVPLLGLLFQRNDVAKTKTELLIFLTPHVALNPDTLNPMSRDEMKGLKLTPSAVSPGVFDEHMRGLQRGTTQPTTDPFGGDTPTH